MTQNSKDSHPGHCLYFPLPVCYLAACWDCLIALQRTMCREKMEILTKFFAIPHMFPPISSYISQCFTYYFLFLWAFLKFPLAFLPAFYVRSYTAYIIFPLALWIWKEPLKLVCLFLLFLNLLFPSFPHSLFLSRQPHPLPLLLFFFTLGLAMLRNTQKTEIVIKRTIWWIFPLRLKIKS